MSATVLIVDDEVELAVHLGTTLRREGYKVALAHSASGARERMAEVCPDVVLMDLMLGNEDGGVLMQELRAARPDTPFVIITAHGSIRSAVECSRRGAADYLTKPFDPDELLLTLRNVLRSDALRDEVRRLRSLGGPGDEPVARAPSMVKTLAFARQVARQDGIVLLLGESGAGKDHVARFIHACSPRAEGPYFALNCAALSRDLAESELFGHEAGAFTGARGRKRGLLELASRGTLLLNEIGEMDLALQAKLLSFLDTRTFLRVGGETPIGIDARIIAATNRNLEEECARGAFRRDLYYRLAVLPIRIPPLRERREDVPALASRMLDRLASELALGGRPALDAGALEALVAHDWPGNVRELRNVIERAVIVAQGATIGAHHLALPSGGSLGSPRLAAKPELGFHEAMRETGRALVLGALRRGRTKQEAAALLGLSRHALAYQMKALGIDEEEAPAPPRVESARGA